MEPEQISQESDIHTEPKPHVWNTVTPLSKYLAMVLFVLLPFVGGYLGYQLAPERVVEVKKEVVREVEADNRIEQAEALQEDGDVTSDNKISYRQFVEVDTSDYPNINKQYFIENPSESLEYFSDDVGVSQALRLNENTLLLFVASNNRWTSLVYDEQTELVVREVPFPAMSLNKWYDNTKIIYVGGNANEIRMLDLLSGESVTLYNEIDPEVQLVEFWEMGQTGKLKVENNSVVFGRYKKLERTTATEFIEEVSVLIPEKYESRPQ